MNDKLVSEYIGKNAQEIIDGNVNWAAAVSGQLIGPVWFFYRKSYLLGFAFLVLTYIVGAIASAINFEAASLVMFFIYLFTANKLYLWDVKRKLNKIMASGNMSEDQLLDTVREKGGTNTLAAVIYVIVIIAYLVVNIIILSSLILSVNNAVMGIQ